MRKREVEWSAEDYLNAIQEKASYWSIEGIEGAMFPGTWWYGAYYRVKGTEAGKGKSITLLKANSQERGYMEMLEKLLSEIEKEAIVNGR